jgi:Xaa-Pro aminopeptidase
MFSTETYQQRRQKLQETVDGGLLLFLGNEDSPMNYTDNIYPFRQDSAFLYFFGLSQPHLAAIIDLDEQETILYGDDISVEHIVWTGPQPKVSEKAARVGVQKSAPYAQLEQKIQQALSSGQQIHFLPPYRAINRIQLSQWLSIPIGEVHQKASEALIRAVIALASIKEAQEIVEMEKALAATQKMHHAAMNAARPGIKEAQLAGIVEGIAVATGGRLAYPAIMTINGQTLHNHDHSNTLQPGQMVLGDFGAESASFYASDITRTFPVSGAFTPQQKDIYSVVLDAQMSAIEALRPGIPFRDVHLLASERMAEGLKALGLMKGDPKEAVRAGAHALFFPHGLGHMIGMDVHDMEGLGEDYVGYDEQIQRSTQFGLKSLRLGKALEPGFVVTVEPGIYFIPELIGQWQSESRFADFINYDALDAYRTFSGIRIEDNLLITQDGYRLLGPPIAKTIEEVEAICQK